MAAADPDVECAHGGSYATENGPRAAETLREDKLSAALLFALYTLQGIPMGLSASIPFLLQSRVTYKQQAVLSLVALPFSLKLLWAPIIDGLYSERFGRRKSWLVPIQILCGGVMIVGAAHLPAWMGDAPGVEPDVNALAGFFGFLFFLMATQDVAVDGWALTMLSPARVAWAGAINSVGQTLGYFLSYVGFLALNDEGTCNRFLRARPGTGGMVSLGGFVAFWGWAFLFTTVVVWVGKAERPEAGAAGGVLAMYREAWECAKLWPVRQYALVLLTAKVGSAAADAATSLKLTEYGMPKEELAFLSPLLIGAGVLAPLVLSRFTTGKRPMSVYLWGLPLRLCLNPLYVVLVPLAAKVCRFFFRIVFNRGGCIRTYGARRGCV
ncbi:acetyl-coenzyme A transporter 1-domain-containing protein [Pavlovales sp. CCMP2436]|nr:acetyl-coenzyme A transporter 1-domain-containing protein [Pavlovales sp. CCMP2436]